MHIAHGHVYMYIIIHTYTHDQETVRGIVNILDSLRTINMMQTMRFQTMNMSAYAQTQVSIDQAYRAIAFSAEAKHIYETVCASLEAFSERIKNHAGAEEGSAEDQYDIMRKLQAQCSEVFSAQERVTYLAEDSDDLQETAQEVDVKIEETVYDVKITVSFGCFHVRMCLCLCPECLRCPMVVRSVCDVLWLSGVYSAMSFGCPECLRCPMVVRSVCDVLWLSGVSAMSYGCPECLRSPFARLMSI
jgi:hypothetical protein